jgi:hypothetical protein
MHAPALAKLTVQNKHVQLLAAKWHHRLASAALRLPQTRVLFGAARQRGWSRSLLLGALV